MHSVLSLSSYQRKSYPTLLEISQKVSYIFFLTNKHQEGIHRLGTIFLWEGCRCKASLCSGGIKKQMQEMSWNKILHMINQILFFLPSVAPSKPECKIVGTAEYGQTINLTCFSHEGSPKPTYTWQSFSVQNEPRVLQTTKGMGISKTPRLWALYSSRLQRLWNVNKKTHQNSFSRKSFNQDFKKLSFS